jgi:hypothetical protein
LIYGNQNNAEILREVVGIGNRNIFAWRRKGGKGGGGHL